MSQYYYNPFANVNDDARLQEQAKKRFELAQREKEEKSGLRKISVALGLAIIAYLVIQTIASSLMMTLGFYDLYKSNAVFQYAFNIIFISVLAVAAPFGIVAFVNRKKYKHPIIPNTALKASRCAAWVCFGMACCIIANIVVNFVVTFFKEVLKLELTQGELLRPGSVFACILELIGLAVIPAVCEEFAMRCCSLQLLRKYGTGFGVFSVSIVFGLLHGNVIQFLFAFIIGLVLGFVTVKTESIVPAILIHMFNNGMSAFQDILKYAAGEKISENSLVVLFIFWIVTGAFAGLYLLFKGELKKESNTTYDGVLSFGQRMGAFLFPGMIVPFIILILITCTTVSKI